MKIVAACAWYSEPLEFLDRMVRSLAGHVDELVCLDGAWKHFPGARASSGRSERDTIRAAASEISLPCRIVVPANVWDSQVAKRGQLFKLAIREQKADWVVVVDGDVTVSSCDDAALRASLDLTGLDVAEVLVRELNAPFPYSGLPKMEVPQRHIWRGHPGLTVETAHHGIRIGPRWLNGDPAHVRLEPALDLSGIVAFDHDNMNRPKGRVAAACAYRKAREEQEFESWL